MDLKRKLARLRGFPGAPAAPDATAAAAGAAAGDAAAGASAAAGEAAPTALQQRLLALRAQLAAMRLPPRPPAPAPAPAAVLPGRVLTTEHGEVYVVDSEHPPGHRHGDVPLAWGAAASALHAATLALDRSLLPLDTARLLYLDTETTGLAGGAGTVPFLVGLGWFEAGAWRMQQLLLRAPGQEVPLLRHLAARLRWASAIVTYNGKCFDWPLLRARFVLNRLPPPPDVPHLDLLHCARRLLRHRHDCLRLTHLEREVVGFMRQGDIDGAVIPAIYFSFLRGAPATSLVPIIAHNRHDIVTLAALLGVLARRLEADAGAAADVAPPAAGEAAAARLAVPVPHLTPQALGAADSLAVARLWWRCGDAARARHFAARALVGGDAPTRHDALWLQARLARRGGDVEAAARALHGALVAAGADPQRRAAVHLALAKLYEHRLADVPQALLHARAAGAAEQAPAHARRLARLGRRLAGAPSAAVRAAGGPGARAAR